MFIHIEYSLQIHRYYNGVQELLRYKSIQEVIYISAATPLASQVTKDNEGVTSSNGQSFHKRLKP